MALGRLNLEGAVQRLARAGREAWPGAARRTGACEDGAPAERRRSGAAPIDERDGDPSGTERVLHADPHMFTSILFLLLCLASVCLLLSAAALDDAVVLPLARRLLVAAATSGLLLTHFVRQLAHHLAATLVTVVMSFPALLTLLLAARSGVAYVVAAVLVTLATGPRDFGRGHCLFSCTHS